MKNCGRRRLRLVLDTNEWIGALGAIKNPSSELLLNVLLDSFSKYSLHIPQLIIIELFLSNFKSPVRVDESNGRFEVLIN